MLRSFYMRLLFTWDSFSWILFYNQISYGRFTIKRGRNCEIDLFIVQSDGRKILDSSKQNALISRLRAELQQPLRVVMMNRGPDTELLVTNPVELSGKGRPQVFHDIALALKKINTCIFSVYIYIKNSSNHTIGAHYQKQTILISSKFHESMSLIGWNWKARNGRQRMGGIQSVDQRRRQLTGPEKQDRGTSVE